MDLSKIRANVEILKFCKVKMAEIKEMQALSRALVVEALGDNEVGELDGQLVVTYRHTQTRRLDQALLKEKYPDIYDECCTINESRRFEIK